MRERDWLEHIVLGRRCRLVWNHQIREERRRGARELGVGKQAAATTDTDPDKSLDKTLRNNGPQYGAGLVSRIAWDHLSVVFW